MRYESRDACVHEVRSDLHAGTSNTGVTPAHLIQKLPIAVILGRPVALPNRYHSGMTTRNVLIEGAVTVTWIQFSFAIVAWWDEHAERAEEAEILNLLEIERNE